MWIIMSKLGSKIFRMILYAFCVSSKCKKRYVDTRNNMLDCVPIFKYVTVYPWENFLKLQSWEPLKLIRKVLIQNTAGLSSPIHNIHKYGEIPNNIDLFITIPGLILKGILLPFHSFFTQQNSKHNCKQKSNKCWIVQDSALYLNKLFCPVILFKLPFQL